MKIDVCFSPLLYHSYVENNDLVVVVADIFRATTTMCTAIYNGASGIIPVRSIEEANDYKTKGYLIGGERNLQKFEFGDFGNSPSEYTEERVKDKDIVISTTNGTRAIDEAVDCESLVIGSFSNLSTVADYCTAMKKDVLVLCSGWKDRFNIEDTLFGGALVEKLLAVGFCAEFDAAQTALSLWNEAKSDLVKYVRRGEHLERLENHGLLDVVEYCLTPDTINVLPIYNKETKRITNKLK